MKYSVISVNAPDTTYEVTVGKGLLATLASRFPAPHSAVIVTDSNVGPLYAAHCGLDVPVITLPAGEQYKTLASVQQIYDALLEAGLDRGGTIIALGGGVIGDMAGFAAATYMRGINFLPCPTSLLAMVDASVGGKTGVDLPQGKNLVGAFKQPVAVLADLDTLTTLPPVEFAAGLAELVKHALLTGPEQFDPLTAAPPHINAPNLPSLITQAIQVKRDIVQIDPYEEGQRAFLNLGHTFAHAIEQVTQYQVRHGEAVAMGLVAATHLSHLLDLSPPGLTSRLITLLSQLQLPTAIPAYLSSRDLIAAMAHDKKKAAGQLRFILLTDVGKPLIKADVSEAAVWETLRLCKAEAAAGGLHSANRLKNFGQD